MIIPSAVVSPPEMINISDNDVFSWIQSLFDPSKNLPTIDPPVPKWTEHKNEESSKNVQIQTNPE